MKVNKLMLFIVAAVPFVAQASSLEVTTTMAGLLENRVSDAKEVTSLKINGPIDAGDMYFIGRKMLNLSELDLSDATIEEVKGAMIEGRSSYPPATIPPGAFAGLPLTALKLPTSQHLTIGEAAFASTGFKTVELPTNIDSIGHGVFAGCADLTKVVFPRANRTGESIFAECEKLVEADMNGVSEIPAGTFRSCTSLTTVTGTQNVTKIGNRAFSGDVALKNFEFGTALKEIGDEAFALTGLETAELSGSRGLTRIGDRSFAQTGLASLKLPMSLQEIGAGAFFGNANLEISDLGSGVITLGAHSLIGTVLPANMELPSSLQEIGDYALMGQDKVRTLTLPSGLIYIGDHGMEGMTGLSTIYAGALRQVPELGEDVWAGVAQNKVTLSVPDMYADEFKEADQWKEFKQALASSRDDVLNNEVSTGVYGRFVGTALQLESKGSAIQDVRLFDASGRQLTAVAPRSATVTVETGDYPGGVFIVSVVLEDNTAASLKLAR